MPISGVIRELASGRTLTPQELVERLAVAPRVLVGEQHDNPDHHALQLWLLRQLAAQRPQGSLLMEMLNPDQQAKVDAAQAATRAGQPPADPYQALSWQANWDWSVYGALVTYALRQPYPLLSANLDRAQIMQIYKQRPTLRWRGVHHPTGAGDVAGRHPRVPLRLAARSTDAGDARRAATA